MLSPHAVFFLSIAVTVTACARAGSENQDHPAAEYDHVSGRLQRLTFDSNGDGRNDAAGVLDGARVKRIEVDTTGNGAIDRWEFYDADGQIARVGLARLDDGVMDSVAVYGRDQHLIRIEVSTGRDSRFDRVEFYQAGRLARAEEDTDSDGRIDKWETYRLNPRADAGDAPVFISAVAFDDAATGRPTRRLVYGPDGQVVRVELVPDGDLEERRQGAPVDPKERRQGVPVDPKERRQGVPVDPKERRRGVPVDGAFDGARGAPR